MIVDLSHYIEEGMPVYPGTEAPSLMVAKTIEADGFTEKLISMYSHTGTHMDGPAHILPGAATLDSLSIDTFTGEAIILDVTSHAGDTVGLSVLKPYGVLLQRCDFLLLYSGWDRLWGDNAYFSGYPVLDSSAAEWLSGIGLKGLGMDCISADPADNSRLPIHRTLLGSGMVIIENLTNLHCLPQKGRQIVSFICLPLKIRDADGSPVRAMAKFEEK